MMGPVVLDHEVAVKGYLWRYVLLLLLPDTCRLTGVFTEMRDVASALSSCMF